MGILANLIEAAPSGVAARSPRASLWQRLDRRIEIVVSDRVRKDIPRRYGFFFHVGAQRVERH